MTEQIRQFLRNTNTGKRSDGAVRLMVAEHFGGSVKKQYVDIDGVEYMIRRNPDEIVCGFDVRAMDWTHGNDWRFYSPY